MSNFKKYLIYFICFVIIIFIIPALCTIRTTGTMAKTEGTNDKQSIEQASNEQNEKQEENTSKYNYSKYATVKLLHKQSNTIQELPIDEYLYGVVSAEMPANYEIEALKAQAVAARTYTIYKIEHSKGKHENADICDDSTCCQAWISKEERLQKWEEKDREENWNKILTAVNSTAGKIITYNNKPINAFFHSNSGGVTEVVSNVWGGTDLPYLKSVETSGEDGYSQYKSEVTLTKEDLLNKLKQEYKDIQINFDDNESIKILEYTESRRVKTVKFGNTEIPGTKVRSIFELKSTNFEIKKEGDNIIFSVIGYGHGVGMSQTGANSMAKSGKNFEEILKHFYTGVEIVSFGDGVF